MKVDEPLFGLVADWSVRRPNKDDPTAKRLVIIGQDECVFMQYLLGTKYWTGPKGERPLLPKSEGDAYMVAAFSGRDIAFGLKLTDEEMAEVNRRRKDTSYIDKAAAKELYNCEKKQELKVSPFTRYLLVGANNEGYWNNYHMAIQLEDVIDCLKVRYPTEEYDILFVFDHSQGHDKKREKGLDVKTMNSGFGGKQPPMRESKIEKEEGYLGGC